MARDVNRWAHPACDIDLPTAIGPHSPPRPSLRRFDWSMCDEHRSVRVTQMREECHVCAWVGWVIVRKWSWGNLSSPMMAPAALAQCCRRRAVWYNQQVPISLKSAVSCCCWFCSAGQFHNQCCKVNLCLSLFIYAYYLHQIRDTERNIWLNKYFRHSVDLNTFSYTLFYLTKLRSS